MGFDTIEINLVDIDIDIYKMAYGWFMVAQILAE